MNNKHTIREHRFIPASAGLFGKAVGLLVLVLATVGYTAAATLTATSSASRDINVQLEYRGHSSGFGTYTASQGSCLARRQDSHHIWTWTEVLNQVPSNDTPLENMVPPDDSDIDRIICTGIVGDIRETFYGCDGMGSVTFKDCQNLGADIIPAVQDTTVTADYQPVVDLSSGPFPVIDSINSDNNEAHGVVVIKFSGHICLTTDPSVCAPVSINDESGGDVPDVDGRYTITGPATMMMKKGDVRPGNYTGTATITLLVQ